MSSTSSPSSPSSPTAADGRRPSSTPTALVAFAWTFVGVPLAYGLYQTVKTAADLFTGG